MPRLRRLTGRQVIKILTRFGYAVARITGSHHQLRRKTERGTFLVTVPFHGHKPIPTGTLHRIYRQALQTIPEEDLRPLFYAD